MDRKKEKQYKDKLKKIENGSMVLNMEDAKFLGKQMENMRSNEELKEYGRVPDPIQYEIEVEDE